MLDTVSCWFIFPNQYRATNEFERWWPAPAGIVRQFSYVRNGTVRTAPRPSLHAPFKVHVDLQHVEVPVLWYTQMPDCAGIVELDLHADLLEALQ